jgi:hypothetical protein
VFPSSEIRGRVYSSINPQKEQNWKKLPGYLLDRINQANSSMESSSILEKNNLSKFESDALNSIKN